MGEVRASACLTLEDETREILLFRDCFGLPPTCDCRTIHAVLRRLREQGERRKEQVNLALQNVFRHRTSVSAHVLHNHRPTKRSVVDSGS